MIATGAIVGVVPVAKQTRLRLSSTVCSNHLAWGSMFRRLTSSASVALSGRALFTSRQLLARVSGDLAAALPAGALGTRRAQARVGVVVLRATVCAAIRFADALMRDLIRSSREPIQFVETSVQAARERCGTRCRDRAAHTVRVWR